MKKFVSVLLSAALLFSMSVPAFASDDISVGNNEIVTPKASQVISSNRPPAPTASAYSTNIMLTGFGTADITITLERKSGSSWEYVDSESWSNQSFSSKTFRKSFSITQSGTYRCVSSVSASVNGNYDSSQAVSGSFYK